MAFAWSLPTPPLIHVMLPWWCSFGRAAAVAAHDTDETASAHVSASDKANCAVFIFVPLGLYQSAGLLRRADRRRPVCNLVRLMLYTAYKLLQEYARLG